MNASRPITAPHPRLWARRLAVAERTGRRRLRALAVGGGVLLVAGAALGVLHSGLFEARVRTLVGSANTPPPALWAAAGIGSSTPLVDIDPAAAARRVERLPWVATATVTRHWPDRVVLSVTSRVAVAVIGAGPDALVVDPTGRVLTTVAEDPAAAGLPVVEVPVRPVRPGQRVGAAADPALAAAAAVPAALATRVQAVAVGAGGWVTVSLGHGVTATLGPPTELAAKFESLAAVLADPVSDPTGPATIDVTDPEEPTVGPAEPA